MNRKELQKYFDKHGVQMIIGAYGDEAGCEGLVEKRDIQVDGKGNYTKLIGCSYLFKGFPDKRVIADLAVSKKLIKIVLSCVNTWWGKLIAGLLFILPQRLTRKITMRFIRSYHEISYPIVKKHLYPPDRYCPAVREIDRALRIVIDEFFGDEEREIIHWSRDTGCIILELDAAYKWPLQEVCSLVNKNNLKENPLKELRRVFAIYQHRDRVMGIKLEAMKKVVFLLRFNRFLLKFITRFLLELDIEKVRMDKADWYFCLKRHSYDFGGMSLEERKRERIEIDKEKGHNIPNVVYRQAPAQTPAGETLKATQKDTTKK